MKRPISLRNRVALLPVSAAAIGPALRGPLAATLAGLLLGLLPPPARAEPNVVDLPPPRLANNESPGSLVIVGGGGMTDSIRDRFLELAGGRKGHLVVIPTASEQADLTRIYKSLDFWRTQGLASVSMLNTLDPKTANDPSFVKPLTEATAAWLGGGDQSRLVNAYRGTAVERELRRLLARGGVVGGTSAGASAMSRVMITGGNPDARVGTGFGFLPDVVIDQHFENRKRRTRLLNVLSQYPRYLGFGIDEQTAVVVRGHQFTVLGKAHVAVCLPPAGREHPADVQVLKSGETGDLLRLSNTLMSRLQPPPVEIKSVAAKDQRTTP